MLTLNRVAWSQSGHVDNFVATHEGRCMVSSINIKLQTWKRVGQNIY